MINFHLMEIIN